MKKLYSFLIFCLFLSVFTSVFSQGKIHFSFGVLEANSNAPIENAICEITQKGVTLSTYKSDAEGKISFYVPNDQAFRIIFSKEGYTAKKFDYDMSEIKASSLDLDVMLVASNMYLFKGSLYNKEADQFLGLVPVVITNLYTHEEFRTYTDEVGLVYYYVVPFQKYEIRTEADYLLNRRAMVNTDCGEKGEIKFCLTGFSFENYSDPEYDAKTIIGTMLLDSVRFDQGIQIESLNYESGQWAVPATAIPQLNQLVQMLTDNLSLKIQIASHTDSRGDAEANEALSQKRAEAVTSYLEGKGIASKRLIAKGYGEERLLNGCTDGVSCSETQHQENRRTEFVVIGIIPTGK